MTPPVFIRLLFLCCLIPACVQRISSERPNEVAEKFPDPYAEYQILPDSVSPNQQFAILVPRDDLALDQREKGTEKLALVRLKPYELLCEMPNDSFLPFGKSGYQTAWKKDSTALLFADGRKWGPDRLVLLEMSVGKSPLLTDLAALAKEKVRPQFRKSKMPHYNHNFDFIIDGWDNVGFTKSGDVAIDFTFTNNPKPDESNVWKRRWQAVWSRSQKKFFSLERE